MTNIFLTGKRHVGKTTLLRKVLKEVGSEYRGVVTEAYPKTGKDKMIEMSEVSRPGSGVICGYVKDGVKHCRGSVFDTMGVSLLEADNGEDLVVIDEIGSMEADAAKYSNAILRLLERSDVMVFGVIQNDCQTALGMRIRTNPDVEFIEVTEGNRDVLVAVLVRRLREALLQFQR